MASTVFPAAAAGSKTLKRVTLLTGTSYTVPSGVTEINVFLIGGGGGCAFTESNSAGMGTGHGYSGQTVWSTISTTPGASISYAIGAGGAGGDGVTNNDGTTGGTTTMTGATSALGGGPGYYNSGGSSARASVANNGGNSPINAGGAGDGGGSGGPGLIFVEYWS